jgi:glucans biosynthesis protein
MAVAPLQNPSAPLVTSFAMKSLKGFGLMQRDRTFANYEDTEARYELRPSAWVTPVGDWGAGRVELLQFATPDETHDNVAAYWVPEKMPAPASRWTSPGKSAGRARTSSCRPTAG